MARSRRRREPTYHGYHTLAPALGSSYIPRLEPPKPLPPTLGNSRQAIYEPPARVVRALRAAKVASSAATVKRRGPHHPKGHWAYRVVGCHSITLKQKQFGSGTGRGRRRSDQQIKRASIVVAKLKRRSCL